ncbi:MFS general substrate transporter [Meredithblackwellia eburnea MCA 4105]
MVLGQLFASDWAKGMRPPVYFWHAKGVSSFDKKLIFKLDCTILVYGCLSFWIKYLDQVNINNAYVTGMKEDLHMFGNQLTLAITLFGAGNIIFQIPSNLLITRIPPRIWLPGCEFVWGICTLLTYKCTSVKGLYALRFLIGLLEGSCFVGMHWIFGTWYTKKEIGKRAALFAMCAYAGGMFSGFIQSGVQKGLNGRGGIKGWQWLFIIDAILTFAVSIFGIIMFPGTPEKCTAWYLSEEEKKRAVERLREDGKGHETDIISLSLFKRVLGSWQLWVLLPTWCCWNNTLGKYSATVATNYLKSNTHHKYSVYEINNLPTIIPGVNIVMILLTAWMIDVFGRRLAIIYFCLGIQLIGMIIVNVWSNSNTTQFAGIVLGSLDGPTSPILLTYANILCYGDAQQRALTLAIMNSVASMTATLINQFVYPVTTAPRFKKGLILSTCAVLLEWIGVTIARYVELKTEPERQAAMQAAIAESNLIEKDQSSIGEDIKEMPTAGVNELINEKSKAGATPSTTM